VVQQGGGGQAGAQRRARSQRQANAESKDNTKTIAQTSAIFDHFRSECDIDPSPNQNGRWMESRSTDSNL
jgi:hypothetical protein